MWRNNPRVTLCGLAFAASVGLFAQSTPAPPAFEAVSVRRNPAGYGSNTRWKDSPGRLHGADVPLEWVIMRAYKVPASRISGPDWFRSEGYDFDATFLVDTPGREIARMLETLLAERFKLAVHRETKDRAVHRLRVDRGGLKARAASEASALQVKMDGPVRHMRGKASIAKLAAILSDQLHQTVVDQTGLQGVYDIAMDFTLDENAPANEADLRTAVETQLGLKLELKMEPLEILVIDHVEKIPVAN